ncbi:hypothetical protein HYPSUDRAFT_210066 [Hypholoma sublateritium FD-334 SS-4]|uniref:Uncharacterized protein n=1 Tax=Hypholoma sublateritium (strain FD-334 SS-4) TaxID=945553 RepID=A0A0D2N0W4_HYPSF|nr:hypothetical protein HYPSUDRAFT_210066 [Hypholoma sublateritium FD-334 SS-4]
MTPASTSSSSLDVVVIPADLVSSNFDMFEFARQLFPPVVAFLTDPDYDNFSDKQTRNFLREHQDTLACQVEMIRLANGGGLAGAEAVVDDHILGVFQWYNTVARRLRKKDRGMVDDSWLPKFSKPAFGDALMDRSTQFPAARPGARSYLSYRERTQALLATAAASLADPNTPLPKGVTPEDLRIVTGREVSKKRARPTGALGPTPPGLKPPSKKPRVAPPPVDNSANDETPAPPPRTPSPRAEGSSRPAPPPDTDPEASKTARISQRRDLAAFQAKWAERVEALPASFRGEDLPPPIGLAQVNALREVEQVPPAVKCSQCIIREKPECNFVKYGHPCAQCKQSHAGGPPCTFVAAPEDRARAVSRYHSLGQNSLEAFQLTIDEIQFNADQALIARRLSEASTARALELRDNLLERLRDLYQSDFGMAASSCYTADDAVTLALRGLLERQEPVQYRPAFHKMDRLLLHADPKAFTEDDDHPHVAAYRAALVAARRPLPEAMDPRFVDGDWPLPEGYADDIEDDELAG